MSSLGDAMTRAIQKRQEQDKAKQQDQTKDPAMYEKAKQILGYGTEEEKKIKPS
jgi:hypothetical protein